MQPSVQVLESQLQTERIHGDPPTRAELLLRQGVFLEQVQGFRLRMIGMEEAGWRTGFARARDAFEHGGVSGDRRGLVVPAPRRCLGHLLEQVQAAVQIEAAGQGGDLLRQDADLLLLPLAVVTRGHGGLERREQARGLLVGDVLQLDHTAPLWLMEEIEVLRVQ